MLANKLSGATQVPSTSLAKAVDFDGTDYLNRTTKLTGIADSYTVTVSCWVWLNANQQILSIGQLSSTSYFFVRMHGTTGVTVGAYSGVNQNIALATTNKVPLNTWANILISLDTRDSAKCFICINDISVAVTQTTYNSGLIGFNTSAPSWIGAASDLTNKYQGRLSHLYMDFTYRDLSIEANRRLFITANLNPASGQAALNPILYLPLDDPTTAHINLGTGGDYTLNGTIARSGRGPNQYNVPYSTLNGNTQYLSISTLTGSADAKTFTFFSCIRPTRLGAGDSYFVAHSGTGYRGWIRVSNTGVLEIHWENSAQSTILSASSASSTIRTNRNYVICISIDLSDANKRHVYLNGTSLSMTWSTYTNDNMDFTASYLVGTDPSVGSFFQGNTGSVFFHNTYIDLSVANNLAKFVTGTGIDAKPVDLGSNGSTPLGVQPLIYLPMYGNNAGKNYGSGGDFTVNSGPYTGARGPNEYWGNIALFNTGTGAKLTRTGISGITNSKTFSMVFWVRGTSSAHNIFKSLNSYIDISINSSNAISVQAKNSSGTSILNSGSISGVTLSSSAYSCVMVSVDLSDTAKRNAYVDGTLKSPGWGTYTNDSINFSASETFTIGDDVGNDFRLGEIYFTTQYIDFSQEANRLKFRDAFGYPVDLGSDGSKPTGATPEIYMRFPPTSFGNNYGTGGNFTVSNTITDGGQF